VNSVAPGPTRTLGVAAEWGDTNEELGRALPLGRTAFASEIAEAVLFLSSPVQLHHRIDPARRRRRRGRLRSGDRSKGTKGRITPAARHRQPTHSPALAQGQRHRHLRRALAGRRRG
jgi:hypothetical protein